MASRIAKTSGDFTAAATWALVNATSMLDSEAGSQTVTTSYDGSRTAAFAGSFTCEGIAVKLRTRDGTTGTITVHLALNSDHSEVAGTAVSKNVADLPTAGSSTNEGGWIFFKFSSPVELAAVNHEVEVRTSSGSQVTLWRDGTAGNVSRMLATSTEAAPAATDIMHVMDYGGAVVVTMENTATTDFGSGTDASAALTISTGGTLNFAYAASTAYYLKLSGNLIIYNGGVFTMGTAAHPIPITGSAIINFDPAATGGMGWIVRNGGSFTSYGVPRTAGKLVTSCKLNTDEATNSTSLGVDTDTGWLDNDAIAIASTTATVGQCKAGALNGDAGADTLTVDGFGGAGGGLQYDYKGTAPVQAEIINLTRNVKIRGNSSSRFCYGLGAPTANVTAFWTEFYNAGVASGTSVFSSTATTGKVDIEYCSFYTTGTATNVANGVKVSGATMDMTFYKNVFWSIGGSQALSVQTTGYPTTAFKCNDNVFIYGQAYTNTLGISFYSQIGSSSPKIECKNNTVVGYSGDGIILYAYSSITGGIPTTATPFDFSGNTVHSCGTSASAYAIKMYIEGSFCLSETGAQIDSLTSYFNAGYGFGTFGDVKSTCYITNPKFFGNAVANIYINNQVYGDLVFRDGIIAAYTDYASAKGLVLTNSVSYIRGLYLDNCKFGVAEDDYTTHTTADMDVTASTSGVSFWQIHLNNCALESGTDITGNDFDHMKCGMFIKATRYGQVDGVHKTWYGTGTVESDTTVYNTAAPSEKVTPTSETLKVNSGSKKVAVDDTGTISISVYVRKSEASSGDAADYNGNEPRLILKRNSAAGIMADVVCDTMTAGLGDWEELTYTTAAVTDNSVLEFYIDCDGSEGFINVDDWSAS
jgi:hypothetical protein